MGFLEIHKHGVYITIDRATLTYADGSNSVTISGIPADAVTLKFGDDDSLLYDELVSAGCFGERVSAQRFLRIKTQECWRDLTLFGMSSCKKLF